MASKKTPLFFLILAGIGLIIFSLPFLCSVPPGKTLLLYLLKSESKDTLSIEKLHFQWSGPQTIENIVINESHFSLSGDSLSIDLPFVKLLNLKKHLLSSRGIIEGKNFSFSTSTNHSKLFATNGKIQFSKKKDSIDIFLEGKTEKDKKSGSFHLSTQIKASSFWKHMKNPSLWNISLQSSLQDFPIDLLDTFFQHVEGLSIAPPNGALQDFTNLKATFFYADSKGNLDIDLSSPTQTLSAGLNFLESQIDLQRPLELSFYLTEDMTKEIRKNNPKFPLRRTKTPIGIRIDSKGFYLPIRPFAPSIFQVGHASVDLGLMVLEHMSALDPLFDFMKMKNPSGTVEVWVTPTNIQIENEVLTLDRMDALINQSIHICMWGSINMKTKKVRMILGIPADTLTQISHSIDVSDDYVLQLPMRGTLDHIKVDTSKASELATEMVGKQMQSLAGGSPWGSIVGGMMSRSTLKGEAAPPPKRPFPWEK
ncbi:MAG: hypothetical protein WCP39_07860 [Chlamydiota bacterium]